MTLDGSLIAYGSVLILPLAVIEGPLVSIATGFLSASGYFDWAWALGLLIVGDLIGDVLYYWIGRSGRTPMVGLLRRFGVRNTVTPDMQRHLAEHSTKMLFIGKWTQSIGIVVLIGSGMLRLPLTGFILVNLVATVPKSLVLFGLGYFASNYYAELADHALITTILLGLVGIAGVALVIRRIDNFRIGGTGR
jgi:membrane protein DedA with SNARE-associated domain